MIRAMRVLLLVLAAMAVSTVHAQTYKWVDERGVVNYSNVPPSKRAVQATAIEDRVSVVPRDPNLAAATAAAQAQSARQAEYAHQEWLARQQSMMQAQAIEAMYSPPADYVAPYYGYGYGYGYGYRYARPVVAPRAVHKPGVRRPVSQASVRRL